MKGIWNRQRLWGALIGAAAGCAAAALIVSGGPRNLPEGTMLFAYIASAAGMAFTGLIGTTRNLLLQILAGALGAAVAAFIFLFGFLWTGDGDMPMSLLLAAILAPLAAIGGALFSLLLGGLGDLIGRRSAADRLIGGVGTVLGAAVFTTFFLILVENFNV